MGIRDKNCEDTMHLNNLNAFYIVFINDSKIWKSYFT